MFSARELGRIVISCLVVSLSSTSVGCVGPAHQAPASGVARASASVSATVRIRVGNRVQRVPLETYVVGTALSEFTPIGESPAVAQRILEVQSVIARTYAIAHLGRHSADGFDLCATTHCQVYEPSRVTTSRFSSAAQRAARETAGQVLFYENRPAQALFHADCGGHTADAHEVWGGDAVSYLRGDDDALPAGTHRTWEFVVDEPALRKALNGDARTAVGRRLEGLRVASRDDSGRAAEFELRGEANKRVRGDALRAVLSRVFGVRSMMSTRLSIERDGSRYRFAGTGFGHGVGLCQVGAAARARRGDALATILTAYYPGSRLSRVKS